MIGFTTSRRFSARSLLCFFLFIAPAASTVRAEDRALQEATAFFGQVLHLEIGVPALVVAAVRGGEVAIEGFGERADGSGQEPDGRTLMRVGSITKAFAGQVLASLAADGTVGLADPLSNHLAWAKDGSDDSARAIRLIDLVTHSAGLPREVPHEPGSDEDPFSNITRAAFERWLGSEPLLFRPGSAVLYSNMGFDLLADALGSAAGTAYPDLLRERVTGPIGMNDTTFAPSGDQSDRILQGHGFEGEALPAVPTGDAIVGSGGLYSTAEDMALWLKWHLDRFGDDGADVRLIDHASYLYRDGLEMAFGMDESGRMDAIGLGWVVMMPRDDRPLILQKAGGLQGIFSYVAFEPTRGVGVFVAINRFDFAAAMAMTEAANDFIASLAPR
ncbi:D-alanyl-D-alanine-carboxypeptidase/endopeptidase AmpH [Faunimonas sp. B44]|uniref:D-alanyl-D-alanine- carboxypeptidase/endopeptidase AmpH n=1 Tax=Faunimonas sp. B44 TaxID=3461493 RepID=UPI004044C709